MDAMDKSEVKMPGPLRIYFSGSISGGREDQSTYRGLIRLLSRFGRVLTEHIGDAELAATGEDDMSDQEIYERDMEWLRAADVLVAEVSIPSLGVGYEIAQMEHLEKPILCLYREIPGRRLSAMMAGNPRLVLHRYDDLDDVGVFLSAFFQSKPISTPR